MQGLSLVAASGGHSSPWCAGLSLSRPLLLQSTGSRSAGSVVVAHGPSCSAACGIFPDQSSNPCPLHWQADSQPLCHQGSPIIAIFNELPWYNESDGATESRWRQLWCSKRSPRLGTISLYHPAGPLGQVILSPFYREENGGSERWNDHSSTHS